jgi:hypothetical protein
MRSGGWRSGVLEFACSSDSTWRTAFRSGWSCANGVRHAAAVAGATRVPLAGIAAGAHDLPCIVKSPGGCATNEPYVTEKSHPASASGPFMCFAAIPLLTWCQCHFIYRLMYLSRPNVLLI